MPPPSLVTVLSFLPPGTRPTGILLPDSVLTTPFFAIFSAFVGINTVIYVSLAVAKILPKLYPTDWAGGRSRRARDRSIYGLDLNPAPPARPTQPPGNN
jgi:hypothetical protein